MSQVEAIILAVIEGITEFLPVSSTGHMVIVSSFFNLEADPFTKLYEIIIQFGAILAVVFLYWKRLTSKKPIGFYINLSIAVLPVLVAGALLSGHINSALENPLFISIVLLTGGIVLLFVDNWFKQSTIESDDQISTRNAFWIGMYQVLAIIFPGLSRSAATIIGGMQQKLNRSLAAEFSFFLAIPTMTAATAKSLLDIIKEQPQLLNEGGKKMLLMGTAIAFFVALIAIKGFIGYVKLKGFKVFGYYRIILGVSLLTLIALGRL